ncbi:MAG: OmpA family protein, partial [FCB group bacterium]
LTSPPGITFENDSLVRLQRSGDLPNVNKLSFGVVGGLSYDIPLNSKYTWFLTPEAYYLYELNNVTKNQNWKISSLKLGLALKYQPRPEKPVVVVPPPVNLTASVKANGVEYDGTEEEMIKIRVEEYLSSRWKPLLTYVFFDDNSAVLPERYSRITSDSAKRFKIQDLNEQGTLEVYHHLLNIIGRRLVDNPDSKITLVGCNNGQGAEKNNKELSMRRAEALRDYLSDIWGIKADRMNIETRNLPQIPSNSNEAEGVEENRRVEITSDNFDIVSPIKTEDTMRVANPPIARFKTTASGTNGISHWTLSSSQAGKTLKTFSGIGDVTPTLDWTFENDEKTIPSKSLPLDYSLSVTDNQGKSFNTPVKSIPIEVISIEKKRRERIADKYVDRYSLIMFSFDKSDISSFNEKILALIHSNLKPNSTVNITGHTDRTGEHDYNVNLSNNRANAVAKSLNFENTNTTGVGEQQLLYNNDVPEGRFYCRRVDVTVETPVE